MAASTITPRVFGPLELTGRVSSHVREIGALGCLLHPEAARDFMRMRAAAARSGIDLRPASAFRDFPTQVRIWNAKWQGQRPLLDRNSRKIDARKLSPVAKARAILLWSAPPGASRHHWGTDLDVYDRAALPEGSRLGLVPAEYASDGPFARLQAWLAAHMNRYGFYRPYVTDRGGVQPEPWHLSHWPTAREASRRLRVGAILDAVAHADIEGKAVLLRLLPEIYARYVRSVDRPSAGFFQEQPHTVRR